MGSRSRSLLGSERSSILARSLAKFIRGMCKGGCIALKVSPALLATSILLGSRPFARDSSIFLTCMQQSPKGQGPGLLHLGLGETAPWPVQIFELVVDSVGYELIGDVPSGLWPDSSVRQLVGRGLLEGRGVSWLLQKQGLDLFSSPLRDCQLGRLRSR
jgi:hypothetical protein